MAQEKLDVVCVIPAKNEEPTIAQAVNHLHESLQGLFKYTILVVDDHSTDSTAQLARDAGATIIRNKENQHGLAAAFRSGNSAACQINPNYILHTDADLQYSAHDAIRVLEQCNETTLSIGDRLWRQPPAMSRIRWEINKELSAWIGDICQQPILDSQSGLRAYPAQLMRDIQLNGRTTYTQEHLIRAVHAGYSVKFTPIKFEPRVFGDSRLVRDPFLFLSGVMTDISTTVKELKIDVESGSPTTSRTTRPIIFQSK